MKLKFYSFFVLLFLSAFDKKVECSEQKNITIYEIQGGIVKMREEKGVVVNLSCKDNCEALKKSRVKILHKELNLSRGKNPGAVACRDVFKSKVVMLRGENGEQTFCLFSDGSLLSTKSIIIK